MSASTVVSGGSDVEPREPWLPMVVIALGQALLSFNAAALSISMAGMVASFDTVPTTVGTAIIMHSLGVSAFILLGARLGQRFGSRTFFQAAAALFLVAMVMMVFSPNTTAMLAAQCLAGLAGAALRPTLVVLIANHFRGQQQCEALGWLGSARAMAGALAFLIIGSLERFVSWRVAFGLLIVLAAVVLLLGTKLKPSIAEPQVRIDWVGVILSASAVLLCTFGFNNLNHWGVLAVRPAAPFGVLGLSPAPLMIAAGLGVGVAFFAWTRKREVDQQTPLLALSVVESSMERAAVLAMFLIVAMEAATNFAVPLYIQIVQGRDAFQTAIAMMPFNLAIFFAAILVVRFYGRFTPRQIASYSFVVVAAAAFWLAFVVRNDWSTVPVLLGLIVFGIGQGSLITLLFNVLVSASPKELAGDVGALRGAATNLAASVGTAVAGALVVGVLSAGVIRSVTANPVITAELEDQLNLDSINFLSNDRLEERLKTTTATPAQITEVMRINELARLRALKIAFLVLGSVSLLAIVPSRRLPGYRPGEVPGR